jgi:hypothetical protein
MRRRFDIEHRPPKQREPDAQSPHKPRAFTHPLFNYQTLTSTRQMKALLRARRASTPAFIPSQSAHTGPASTNKFPAPPAAEKPLPSNDSAKRWSETESEPEFNITDEDRVLAVLHSFRHCLNCGAKPSLERKDGQFRICCYRFAADDVLQVGGPKNNCKQTPWLPTSKDAVQYWRVIAALEK